LDVDYAPPGELDVDFSRLPAPERDDLLVRSWLSRDLPARDYLLGELLCITSRWLLIGETDLGKTLFALELGAAVAAGGEFLGWTGRRSARVMYLDGEMPAETFKERVELIAASYGADIELFGYNRDVLGADDTPSLNTDAGQAWLWREIEAVKPALIIFDSIMCLLTGSMSEEESWAPVKGLVRQISARRIAQIWVHHTATTRQKVSERKRANGKWTRS
jgi:RecA-family ATPase